MKLFVCTDHAGHWPVGVASVIVAQSKKEAKKLLSQALFEVGLSSKEEFTLIEIDLTHSGAFILNDGEY